MSASTITTRRRVSLFASSSLVAASLVAGVASVSTIALAPTAALAADECGDPTVNGAGTDAFSCTGVYAAGITYTTQGDLGLGLVDGVTIGLGGLRVAGAAGDQITVQSIQFFANTGDVVVNNPGGRGIWLSSPDSNIILDLTSNDAGDGAPSVPVFRKRSV